MLPRSLCSSLSNIRALNLSVKWNALEELVKAEDKKNKVNKIKRPTGTLRFLRLGTVSGNNRGL